QSTLNEQSISMVNNDRADRATGAPRVDGFAQAFDIDDMVVPRTRPNASGFDPHQNDEKQHPTQRAPAMSCPRAALRPPTLGTRDASHSHGDETRPGRHMRVPISAP